MRPRCRTDDQVELSMAMTVIATWKIVKKRSSRSISLRPEYRPSLLDRPYHVRQRPALITKVITKCSHLSQILTDSAFCLAATPKSAALSATDIDVVSLDDFNSALSLSDDSESKTKDVNRRPSLSLETNVSVLSWRDEHMKDTAIPIKVKSTL